MRQTVATADSRTQASLSRSRSKTRGESAIEPTSASLCTPASRASARSWAKALSACARVIGGAAAAPAGSQEANFSIAQAVLDPAESGALVVCPNPSYQI